MPQLDMDARRMHDLTNWLPEGEGRVFLGGPGPDHRELTISARRSRGKSLMARWKHSSGFPLEDWHWTLRVGWCLSYTGGTTVSAVRFVTNIIGSATGTGPVAVAAGTFGGGGVISGPVTVGSGGAPPPSSPHTGTNRKSTSYHPGLSNFPGGCDLHLHLQS